MTRRAVVVILALVAAVACGSAPPPATTLPAEVPTLRVMTWNLQRGQALAGRLAVADMAPFAALVARNEADVVGLQEVTREQAEAISGTLGWATPAYVQTKNPCPGFPPPLPASCVPFGNAILSRHPQSDVVHWVLPPSALETSLEDRVVLRSVVDVDGRPLSVYVTHLAANATEDEREAQVEEVLARIGDDTGGVLVGDFNAIPTDDAVTRLTGPFVDAWDEAGPAQPGYTSNAVLGLRRRIDYV
ncbi:MAG TPA: endonuclease/exonuclease/phosphatase family protein, partial [Acidimicrobiales bacterium]